MVFVEYDCSKSTAIERIAYNPKLKQLAVKFRDNSKGSTYVYKNVSPQFQKLLISPNKGKLVAEIKKIADFVEYDEFPRNTRKFTPRSTDEETSPEADTVQRAPSQARNPRIVKKEGEKQEKKPRTKEYKDYSKEWLAILEIDAVRKNRDYLTSLLLLFKKNCNSRYPMSKPPPPFDLPFDADEHHTSSTENQFQNRFSSHNAFSNLLDDDEGDDNDNDNDSDDELIKLTNQLHLEDTASAEPSIQSRYLRVRVILLIADYLHVEAVRAGRSPNGMKKYEDMRLYWTEVYDLLFATCQELDPWFAISKHYDLQDTSTTMSLPLPDYHHAKQLQEILENVEVTKDTVENKKNEALHYLTRRLDLLNKKLNPMLRERDEVKRSVGESNWKDNPDPKFDYAEKRKQWEDEMRWVTATMEVLTALQFVH